MTALVRWLQSLVRRRAGAVLLGFAVASVLAALPAARARVDTSPDNFMMSDDPERVRTREMKADFSNDEIHVLAFDLGRPFEADDLRRLRRVSDAVAALDGVEEVLDLSTIEDVRGEEGELDASPLVDLDTLESTVSEIRERARGHRLYRANLVSDDARVLSLLVLLELRPREEKVNLRVTGEVLELLDRLDLPWPAYVGGYPFAEHDANRIFSRDLLVLTAAAFAVVNGLLFLLLRRLFPLVLASALVGWAQLVAVAWFGLSDTPFTLVTAVVPSMVLANSATYAIYAFGLLQRTSAGPEPGLALLESIARPACLAALSTAIGFLSLRLMPVDAIGELGTGLAVGTAGALIGTLLLIPAAVHRFDLRLEPGPRFGLERLVDWGLRLAERPRATAAVGTALAGIAALGLARLEQESDPLTYWKPESYHRVSDRFIRLHLSGTLPINVVIHGEGEGGALEPEVLRFADGLVREIERAPQVDRTVSFLDYVYLMDAALRPGETPRTVLPSRNLAAQYLLLYEAGGDPEDFRHYIDHGRSTLNVWARVNTRKSSEVLALRDRIRELAEAAPQGVRVEVLGTWLLFPKAMDAITRGMVRGLLTALALITLVMMLSLGSVKLGLVAAIPNAVPIVVCTGLLGWLGVPLSFGTSIVGCVALGLAVDDTAHVLGHLLPGRSLEEVYAAVGRSLVLTTLVLGGGFCALALGEYLPAVHLGVATALTLLVALLCDLLLLPALLALLGWPVRPAARPHP